MSLAIKSYFDWTNEPSSTRQNSINDVFGIIANGNLCVFVLVNISLQVFLKDSQQMSDDFGQFLLIATDGATTSLFKTVLLANAYHLTSRRRALSSLRDVKRGFPDTYRHWSIDAC